MIDDDPLWDPEAAPDAELVGLRAMLAPYSVAARGIARWPALRIVRRRRSVGRWWPLAAAAVMLIVSGLHHHRLQWEAGRSWALDGPMRTLAEGQRIATGDAGTSIEVARIGRIELSPDSVLRLVETRTAHHRVDLEHGHLRARIWAPPGYFGLSDRHREIVDLGCDFEVWKQADGSGRAIVHSGWIAWRSGMDEQLVPAGFEVHFDGERITLPLRMDAEPALRQAMAAFETQRLSPHGDHDAFARVADRVADVAQDTDAITLLSLLTEYPELASGRLYPRLARALGVSVDPTHRRAWQTGSREAIDAWWARLPVQPKRWWLNWRDAWA
ncbi:MAG TPA: hypothetical protein PKO41_04545 [Dokdonella sp.]|uniref:hypothetical protein n=1 Tax=Dokdonella sp. TaxID=2291710 RepID=UPI0025B8B588|nr:hypothetical protein [Dokdonella sp.]MBX3690562.1 hypothetical protein [Dokdonella sp.]MCW5567209.1 hypothetical protein [Dokdonella sp.]HNR91679.1 hypothetical protein [Dokdonella sp.]